MKYFIGIDGGGSQTRAVVTNDVFQVLGRGQAGASNHYVVGAETAANNCREAAFAALENAGRVEPGLALQKIEAWSFCLAGVRREQDAALMRFHLLEVAGGAPFVLEHDAVGAQSGAFGGAPGVVLLAGTGTICFAIDDNDVRYFADGWGPILGDEGGGFWMGQEALKALCRSADGRGPKSRLTAPILNELACKDCDELVRLVYSPLLPRDRVAQLARVVLDTAENGSAVAVEIRDRAVAHLGNAVAAVARGMLTTVRDRAGYNAPPPQEIAIALLGGLFENDFLRASVGYSIGEHLVELKRDYWPIASWRVVKPQYESAVGAALLAERLVG